MSSTETTSAEPVLKMTGVSVGTIQDPEHVVLKDVDWVVEPGEIWVVAGMHGSGKTHLLNLVAGLVPPHSGGYQLCGLYMPITDPDMADHRLNLATVFEDGGLLHQLTIRQNLELPLRYHRSPSQKDVDAAVQSLLDLTGLGPHANSLPGALPRFLLRRAGLARALILQPRAIMLANPLGGLDPRNTTWWLNALVQLSQGEKFMPGRPVAIIATTEELRPWRNTGCHVALLENGKFINLGLCPDFGRVEQPLLKEFLAGEVSQERN